MLISPGPAVLTGPGFLGGSEQESCWHPEVVFIAVSVIGRSCFLVVFLKSDFSLCHWNLVLISLQ